nr:hypothetical protein [Sinorhizobium meliloti]
MRGYLLLTEARSGSNWLGSLVNGAGNMGRSSEWLSPKIHRLDTGAFVMGRILSGTPQEVLYAERRLRLEDIPEPAFRDA